MAQPNEWGLTDAGFRRPTYAELLDALELSLIHISEPTRPY